VSFTVDAFPVDTFSGTVKEVRLQSSVSANVVTYTTIIEAPNDDRKLKPGMTASVVIDTKVVDRALLVPASALTFEPDAVLQKKYAVTPGGAPGAQKVWIKKDASIVARTVQTGMTDDTRVQIVSGVGPGDEVVTGYSGGPSPDHASAAASSPFLPKPPSGTNRKNMAPPPQ
jgi:HlyD family secretion protein